MGRYDGQLRNASNNGELERVQELLARGADPNTPNKYGGTALSLAAENGHVEVIRVLLAAGADPHFRTKDTCTALSLAVMRGQEAAVTSLLNAGIKYTADELADALLWATIAAHVPLVGQLMAAGADPRHQGSADDVWAGRWALDVCKRWARGAVADYRVRCAEIIRIMETRETSKSGQ
jgi:ankyrin repeat protein